MTSKDKLRQSRRENGGNTPPNFVVRTCISHVGLYVAGTLLQSW